MTPVAGAVAATGALTERTPVGGLTVLYDAQCPLCVHLRHWLQRQHQLVPLRMVPAASEEAQRLFPGLDHHGTLREVTVIGDRGQIYRGQSAWIVCLWALSDHRSRAIWLATPAGRPFVRVTMLAAAKYRERRAGANGGWGTDPCDGHCAVPG
ncbi:DCC1-like thiol-disulfide oxidoreductase family protein [Streptomyces sp. NPDC000594]|uniref:thiol-disulfide oxidoreductase DCC family protein n=1 Tax=Streptomyces sp. NPDC000594 TaxID=3154261 RepID=UPI0033319CEC